MSKLKTTQELRLKERLQQEPENIWLLKELGDIYLARSDYTLAFDHYQRSLRNTQGKITPHILISYERQLKVTQTDISLRSNLVSFLVACNEHKEAIDELEEILELDQENRDAYIQLAKLQSQFGDGKQAIKVLEKALTHFEEDVPIMEMLAVAHLDQGNIVEATACYENIYNQQPENVKIIKIMAELYRKNHWVEKSAEMILKCTNYDPNCLAEAHQLVVDLHREAPDCLKLREILGDLLLRWFKPDQAIETYQNILVNFPESQDLVLGKYKKVLDFYPDYPAANFALAELHIAMQSYSEAVLLFNRIVELNKDYLDAVIEGLRKIVLICPEQVLAHQSLAECLLLRKDVKAAVEELHFLLDLSESDVDVVIMKALQIINIDKELLEAQLLLVKGYMVKKDYNKAKSVLNKVFNLDKDNTSALVLLAKIEFVEENSRSAIWNLRKALSLSPLNYALSEEFKSMYKTTLNQELETLEAESEAKGKSEILWGLSQKNYQLDHYDKAISGYQKLLKNSGKTGDVYYALGKCFKEQGQFELALRQFKKALKIEQNEKYLLEAGFCGEALGELKSAVEIYQEIMETDHANPQAKSHMQRINTSSWSDLRGKTLLGIYHTDLIVLWYKNPEMAKIFANDGKQIFEMSFAQSHNNQGAEYAQQKRLKAAEEELFLTLQLDQKLTTAHSNLGIVLLQQNKIEEAKVKFLDALACNPDFYVANYNYGLACVMENNMTEAVEYFRQALEQEPELNTMAVNYGDALYACGEVEKAVEIWKQITDLSVLYELGEKRLQLIGVV